MQSLAEIRVTSRPQGSTRQYNESHHSILPPDQALGQSAVPTTLHSLPISLLMFGDWKAEIARKTWIPPMIIMT